MDPVKCGSFLKTLRKRKGLTQEQLAEMLGVTNRSVSRWETGTNLPDIDVIITLSEFYDVDIKDLLNGESRKTEQLHKEGSIVNMQAQDKELIIKAAEYGSDKAKASARRSRLRIALIALLSVVVTAVLINVAVMLLPASVNYGSSEIFTRVELEEAAAAVKADFSKMQGCKLFSLKYAGDEVSLGQLEYANEYLSGDEPYTDCIVFDSVFHPPVFGRGAWDHHMYYWSWTLVRTENGGWTVLTKGYC